MSTPSLTIWLRLGETTQSTFRVNGNSVLLVTGATASLGAVTVSVGAAELDSSGGSIPVTVSCGPLQAVGQQQGTVTIRTNDPGRPAVDLALNLGSLPPVRVEPPGALSLPTSAGTASVTVTSSLPCTLTIAKLVFSPRNS